METNPLILEYVLLRDSLGDLYEEIGPVLEKIESIPKRFFREYVSEGECVAKPAELEEKISFAKKISEKMLGLEELIPESYENFLISLTGRYVSLKSHLHSDFTFKNFHQAGLINILDALRKYDEKREKFITYLTRWFCGGILNYVKETLKKGFTISLDDSIPDNLSNIEELVMVKDGKFKLLKLINEIYDGKKSNYEQRKFIFKQIYVEETPFKEIGSYFGVSNNRVYQIRDIVIKDLKKRIKKNGLTKEDFI